MRRRIAAKKLLRDLHCGEGGFLTKEECASITGQSDNAEQVDELMNILMTKKDEDFELFCNVLEKHGYRWWSNKLKEAAGKAFKTLVCSELATSLHSYVILCFDANCLYKVNCPN